MIERVVARCTRCSEKLVVRPDSDGNGRLVDWVEKGIAPPQSQCVPRGGAIVDGSGRAERCAALLAN